MAISGSGAARLFLGWLTVFGCALPAQDAGDLRFLRAGAVDLHPHVVDERGGALVRAWIESLGETTDGG